ncbi:MAG: 2',3'-cyclic-nucleotide 2'-phosphodiesterase/3'-nucleotidase [Deltaproteobacteria bacterium]|jgi:2',3'-cyclic-nucleotide 2'-phosphodiesterase/3'-nucleotidase|nr:2',3'-cyclic-nucleotide 2'-phosphodiesterase/3'-nucleotidase [Deltaproteobacteria bacterium]
MSRSGLLLFVIVSVTVLSVIVWFVGDSKAEFGSVWNNWRPLGKSANFEVRYRAQIQPQKGAKTSLLITATSDLHGTLTSTRLLQRTRPGGLLHLAAILKKLREAHPELIMLDAGDTLQGDPSSYYFSHVAPEYSRPLPVIEVMNHLKYDALALGNHDFEPPIRILKQNIVQSRFTWLAANVRIQKASNPLFPPYKVFERAGVRVGVIGMITPGVPLWIDQEKHKGLIFDDMLETAKRWVKVLREKEKIDFLIGLFHSGDNTGYDLKIAAERNLPPPNAAGMIADYLPEFDLIISGHAHRLSPNRRTVYLKGHQTPLISPGTRAQGLSTVKVNFREHSGHWKVSGMIYDYIKAEALPDKLLMLIIEPRLKEVEKYLSQKTSLLLRRFPRKKELLACGADLSHAVLKDSAEATHSLLPFWRHWGKLPKSDLGKPLLREHFFRLLPYDNTLVQVGLYGRQIEILLEPYRRRQLGRYARSSTVLAPGGIVAEPDRTQNDQKLLLSTMNGKQLKQEKIYPVWMTNYHWNGGGGTAAKALLNQSQLLSSNAVHLREQIFQHLSNPSVMLPENCSSFLSLP